MKGISVFGKRVKAWTLALAMIALGAAAVAMQGEPYGKTMVAVSQTIIISDVDTVGWTMDIIDFKIVGGGQYFKAIMAGQGNDYAWVWIYLKNLAGDENLVKIYAENVPPQLKVKFAMEATPPLFDVYLVKIPGESEVPVYMYVLIYPDAVQGTYEFTVRIEVLGG